MTVHMWPRYVRPNEYYRVSAKTNPFTETTKQIVGYYTSRYAALEAIGIVQANPLQRLSEGIHVFCERFPGKPKNLNGAVYKSTIDQNERDRLSNLLFNDMFVEREVNQPVFLSPHKRKSEPDDGMDLDEELNAVPSKKRKIGDDPMGCTSSSLFAQGVAEAEQYAQRKYGCDVLNIHITFHGTDISQMSDAPQAKDPLEELEITMRLDTGPDDEFPIYKEIGTVLSEKNHHIPNVIENLDLGPSQSPGVGRSQLARIRNTGGVEIAPTAGAFASARNQIFNHVGYTTLKTESEIAEEIKALIDRAFAEDPELLG